MIKEKDFVDFGTISPIPENVMSMIDYIKGDGYCEKFLHGEASESQILTIMTHHIDNLPQTNVEEWQRDMYKKISDYIENAYRKIVPENENRYSCGVNESAIQLDFFKDILDVPFPAPQKSDIKFIDLFAGIGGIRIPFDELNCKCVFSSEWDLKACQTYFANFGVMPSGDITKIAAEEIPQHDILLAGFPCQAFSIIGKMKGFADTRGTMFFEIERILKHHPTPYILLENVKQLVGHDGGRTFKVILNRLEQLGYYVKWQVLNALDFGLPQKRERVIIVGFKDKGDYDAFSFDIPHKKYNLADILEPDENVDPKLFASDHIIAKRQQKIVGKEVFYPSIWHENKAGNISILDYSCALRTGASYNYLLVNGVRRPSSRELLRLQGFPEKYKIAVSHQDIRRQTGNSVAVPMIRMVAQKIVEIIQNKKQYGTSETQRFKKVANA